MFMCIFGCINLKFYRSDMCRLINFMCIYATHKCAKTGNPGNVTRLLHNSLIQFFELLISHPWCRCQEQRGKLTKKLSSSSRSLGALGWQEVAALCQFQSQEHVLQDYEDEKRHWTEKLYNKFKKPTGEPGNPVHDRILCCQLTKSSLVIMGAASDEDDNSLSGDKEDIDEEEDDKVDPVKYHGQALLFILLLYLLQLLLQHQELLCLLLESPPLLLMLSSKN